MHALRGAETWRSVRLRELLQSAPPLVFRTTLFWILGLLVFPQPTLPADDGPDFDDAYTLHTPDARDMLAQSC